MNRRQLPAASTLALVGCNDDKKVSDQRKANEKRAGGQKFAFTIKTSNLPQTPRPLTQQEIFYEAHVTGILLTALHPTALASIGSSSAPSGELANADPAVYTSVKKYISNNPGTIEAVTGALRLTIAALSQELTGTSDDVYTGNPDACLDKGNLAIVQGLFTVKPT